MSEDEKSLQREAERLRIRMVELAMQSGSFSSDEVVAASQALDKIVVKLQKIVILKRLSASPS